jgi:hypothetical protein
VPRDADAAVARANPQRPAARTERALKVVLAVAVRLEPEVVGIHGAIAVCASTIALKPCGNSTATLRRRS